MPVQERQDGKATVLQVSGRLDHSTVAEVDQKLTATVAASQAVVVDLADLSYISSVGLRILLQAAKQAQAAKRPFALAGLQPPVKEVFRISGLDTILTIHESAAAALDQLR